MHQYSRRVTVAALLAGAIACAPAGEQPAARDPAGVAVADDFGDTLARDLNPRRIVSLNPATTELFFALGAGDRLVGRTQYDLYPAEALAVPPAPSGPRPRSQVRSSRSSAVSFP